MDRFSWKYQQQAFTAAVETFGSGRPVLFLPALSTVSTRREWTEVAAAMAERFSVTLVDWPGFGDSSRLRTAYSPVLYGAFLKNFVRARFAGAVAVVAAGHAAGYVLRLAGAQPALWSRAVLVAPTWRGPLPTAMGEHRRVYQAVRRAVASPGFGHLLYRANTGTGFLRWMYGRHVFVDGSRLAPAFLREKQRVARRRGARFAAGAFVTGTLDPFRDRAGCVAALRSAVFPVLLVLGADTPAKSRAEMDALAAACAQPPLVVPGSLGLHEENAAGLVTPLQEFLGAPSP